MELNNLNDLANSKSKEIKNISISGKILIGLTGKLN